MVSENAKPVITIAVVELTTLSANAVVLSETTQSGSVPNAVANVTVQVVASTPVTTFPETLLRPPPQLWCDLYRSFFKRRNFSG